MTSAFDQVFWRAVDDLNAGRPEPVEHYLGLVPSDEQDELAALLSTVLAARGPASVRVDEASEGYARALAAVDEVTGSTSPAGALPKALSMMRHARGVERETIYATLADDLGVQSSEGRKEIERFYHQLESGVLLGPKIAHRVLRSLAKAFEADARDFIAGVRPTGAAAKLGSAPAMGRPAGEQSRHAPSGAGRDLVGTHPEVELVRHVFTGGPDA